jgi:hypothetical protein
MSKTKDGLRTHTCLRPDALIVELPTDFIQARITVMGDTPSMTKKAILSLIQKQLLQGYQNQGSSFNSSK